MVGVGVCGGGVVCVRGGVGWGRVGCGVLGCVISVAQGRRTDKPKKKRKTQRRT